MTREETTAGDRDYAESGLTIQAAMKPGRRLRFRSPSRTDGARPGARRRDVGRSLLPILVALARTRPRSQRSSVKFTAYAASTTSIKAVFSMKS